jgi:dipeptidyl aminopeptidase/acylaminoacyl peptidase
LTTSDNLQDATSLSPDGKHLAFTDVDRTTGQDTLLLSLDGSRNVARFLQTRAAEVNARFSPNGRWLAYASNESDAAKSTCGRFPALVRHRRCPPRAGPNQSGRATGVNCSTAAAAVMAVPVSTDAAFAAGLPRRLFADRYERTGTGTAGYDVSLDGRRFLMIEPAEPELPVAQINLVLGWFRRGAPACPSALRFQGAEPRRQWGDLRMWNSEQQNVRVATVGIDPSRSRAKSAVLRI